MKQLLALCLLASLSMACQNNVETKTEAAPQETKKGNLLADNGLPIFRGEFIMIDDGAVLKGANFIYGIHIDDKAQELAKKVEKVKKEEFDMVPVVVRGTLAENPEVAAGGEGWEQLLTIIEIVEVSDQPAAADIKIEEKKS